jgi:hypothetical protein
MFRKKDTDGPIRKPFYRQWWFALLALVVIIAMTYDDDKVSKQPVQNAPNQTTQQQPAASNKTQEQKSATNNAAQEQKPAASAPESTTSQYKVGDVGINGVVMTESLIQYLSEAEKNPINTKGEAENITKGVYTDVTDKSGTMMPEKEMMVKLYQAQIYYNKNNNSTYSTLNGLLIEEFGGRINKTRGASGAAERMNNLKIIYDSIKK